MKVSDGVKHCEGNRSILVVYSFVKCVMQIYVLNKLALLRRCIFCEVQELILILRPNSKHPLSVLRFTVMWNSRVINKNNITLKQSLFWKKVLPYVLSLGVISVSFGSKIILLGWMKVRDGVTHCAGNRSILVVYSFGKFVMQIYVLNKLALLRRCIFCEVQELIHCTYYTTEFKTSSFGSEVYSYMEFMSNQQK